MDFRYWPWRVHLRSLLTVATRSHSPVIRRYCQRPAALSLRNLTAVYYNEAAANRMCSLDAILAFLPDYYCLGLAL